MIDQHVLARAADDLIRLSNTFRGLLDIGEHMKSVASLQQTADEAERRIQDAVKRHDAVRSQMEADKVEHGKQLIRYERQAKEELEAKLSGTHKELEDKQVAHDLVVAQLEQKRSHLNSISTQIAEAKSKLESLGEQIEEKSKVFKAVQERHKALVASISNIK